MQKEKYQSPWYAKNIYKMRMYGRIYSKGYKAGKERYYKLGFEEGKKVAFRMSFLDWLLPWRR